MKNKIAALVAGLVLGSAGFGLAATQAGSRLKPIFRGWGITCMKDSESLGVICNDANGDAIGFNAHLVLVMHSGEVAYIKTH